jgi:DNA topoisomerase-1
MAPALFESVQVSIKNGEYLLKSSGSRLLFDGYQKIYADNLDEDKDKLLPELAKGEYLDAKEVKGEQKFTEPPARFTEASIVKDLEEKNIGRPSTYAPIIATLLDRKYITREKKSLIPTDLGFVVTELMEAYFKELADTGFTAEMEDKLDDVEIKDLDWKDVIRDFYKILSVELEIADKAIEKVEIEDQLTDELCELCGKPMAIKSGRFGEFLACSGYPECKNTKPIVKKTGVSCPDCGGDIVAKRGKTGKLFYGCSNYPSCKKAFWYKPIDRKCPECGSLLLERNSKNSKYVCSNEKCDYKE